jgi:hypothetical protein
VAAAIHVGATKDAVVAARAAVMDILAAPRDEETVRAALTAFVKVCNVEHTVIQNCTVYADQVKRGRRAAKA